MKNFTSKIALFAFLSSMNLSIIPSDIRKLQADFDKKREAFNNAMLQCQQAIDVAFLGKNTWDYAKEKCNHSHNLGLKALEAEKALNRAEK